MTGQLLAVDLAVDAATRHGLISGKSRGGIFRMSATGMKAYQPPGLGKAAPGDTNECADGAFVHWFHDPEHDKLTALVPMLKLGGSKRQKHRKGDVLGSFEFVSDHQAVLGAGSPDFLARATQQTSPGRAETILAVSAAYGAILERASWTPGERSTNEATYRLETARMAAVVDAPASEAAAPDPGETAELDPEDTPVTRTDIQALLEHLKDEPQGQQKFDAACQKLEKYAPQFGRSSRDLRHQDLTNLPENLYTRVNTGESEPIACRQLRTNPKTRLLMEEIVQEMVEAGVIVRSRSAWAAPALLVAKPHGGGWRFVTDFRRLNAVVQTSHHPVPRLDDALDAMAGKTRFSSFGTRSRPGHVGMRAAGVRV